MSEGIKTLTRADLLSELSQPKQASVYIDKLDGRVLVRGMSLDERDNFDNDTNKFLRKQDANEPAGPGYRARVVAASCVDEEGNRLFTPEDAALLGKSDAATFLRLFGVAADVNGLTEDDEEEAGFDGDPKE